MAKNKIGLEFKGFDELIERLGSSDNLIKEAVTDSLDEVPKKIQPELKKQMQKHHYTGETEKSILKKTNVEWEGQTASVPVGFDIKNGGLPSIFLIYGTPRMKKDQALYNAIYGNKVKKEIAKKQEEIFSKAMSKVMGGS